jgi:hypothetical protein
MMEGQERGRAQAKATFEEQWEIRHDKLHSFKLANGDLQGLSNAKNEARAKCCSCDHIKDPVSQPQTHLFVPPEIAPVGL